MSINKPKKRSLMINGHKTSVSLEDPFWLYFVCLARENNKGISKLASEIDTSRDYQTGLATAIRVFCLKSALKK